MEDNVRGISFISTITVLEFRIISIVIIKKNVHKKFIILIKLTFDFEVLIVEISVTYLGHFLNEKERLH